MNKYTELWAIIISDSAGTKVPLVIFYPADAKLPMATALYTVKEQAEVVKDMMLKQGVKPENVNLVKVGTDMPVKEFVNRVQLCFTNAAEKNGIGRARGSVLFVLSFGVYINPTLTVAGPPDHANFMSFMNKLFPDAELLKGPDVQDMKLHSFGGYTVCISKINGSWLVLAKKGIFNTIEAFKKYIAPLGEAYFDQFESYDQAKEEAERWIEGTNLLATLT